MEIVKKYCLIFLVLILQACRVEAESFSIFLENKKDYEILGQFFRMSFFEEQYGYVFEGIKPVSVRNYISVEHFPTPRDRWRAEKEFAKSLLVREAISTWNRLCSSHNNLALKAVSLKSQESTAPGYEVKFINISKLKEVIQENLHLFRYVLGPAIETEQLVNKIVCSDEILINILGNDLVLMGIVLGFGVHNSLIYGRIDKIFDLSISEDRPPFSSKSILMKSGKNHSLSFLLPENYGLYYLGHAGGDAECFKKNYSSLLPTLGFSTLEDELFFLDTKREVLPDSLKENPAFIFGPFKGGPSNQPFLNRLQQAQKRIKTLLQDSHFFEKVLQKIGGKKPLITCNKPNFSESLFSFFHGDTQEWISILRKIANRFGDEERKVAFIKSFSHPSESFRKPPMVMSASKACFEGLKKAISNLNFSNAYFESLSKEGLLETIIQNRFYFKTTIVGSGEKLQGVHKIRVSYTFEDLEGNALFANDDTWLDISQTFPGFAHGVQGMCEGEKRTLFIHPAYAYGALTTIPPCITLIVKIQLLEIGEEKPEPLFPLESHDFSWIENPSYYRCIEESFQQLPYCTGSFYRDMLDKIEGVDIQQIITELNILK